MKKVVIITMLLIACLQINAQLKLVPDNQQKDTRNYFNDRLYEDTLSIDVGSGEMIQIVYRWYDLFCEDESWFDKHFWQAFEASNAILQENLKVIPIDKKLKYHIRITTKRNFNEDFFLKDDQENDLLEKQRVVLVERLWKSSNKKEKEAYRDSIDVIDRALYQKRYPLESTLTVTEREVRNAQREYKLDHNKLVGQAQWQNILELTDGLWQVQFYVNDISDLSAINSIDIREFIRAEKQNYLKKGYYRSYTNLRYKLVDGEIKHALHPEQRSRIREKDVTYRFNPVLGTSIINGKWSVDMGAMIEKRSIYSRLAIRYQLKGIGEEIQDGTSMNFNGFVDLLYDYIFEKTNRREMWIGAGAGYLVHQQGSVYGDNTARFFLKYHSSQMKGIQLQPEFNYSFDDKDGFIGLGVLFSL